QEYPKPIIASRTSPTNIGLGLLSTLAAWDFGYLSLRQLTDRITNALQTLEKLEKYQGHLYNWYDTRTLTPLNPLYLSTVDNGNFAGLLLTLRAGLLELSEQPWPAPAVFPGLRDTLHALLDTCRAHNSGNGNGVDSKLASLDPRLASPPSSLTDAFALLNEAVELAAGLSSQLGAPDTEEFQWWRQTFENLCREQRDEY